MIIFIGIGFLLWGFDVSLSGEDGFNRLQSIMQGFLPKLIVWGILSALLYHFVAGIRHLLMDAGIGETLEGGRLGAKLVVVVAVVLIVLAGVWIW